MKRNSQQYHHILHKEQKGLGVCVSRCLCDFTRPDLKYNRVVLESVRLIKPDLSVVSDGPWSKPVILV